MIVIRGMPGNTPPPPWLALIVGVAMMSYYAYHMYEIRHDESRTPRDVLITAFLFLMGGVIVVYGAILFFHH